MIDSIWFAVVPTGFIFLVFIAIGLALLVEFPGLWREGSYDRTGALVIIPAALAMIVAGLSFFAWVLLGFPGMTR